LCLRSFIYANIMYTVKLEVVHKPKPSYTFE
jgi:hypothetical protein